MPNYIWRHLLGDETIGLAKVLTWLSQMNNQEIKYYITIKEALK